MRRLRRVRLDGCAMDCSLTSSPSSSSISLIGQQEKVSFQVGLVRELLDELTQLVAVDVAGVGRMRSGEVDLRLILLRDSRCPFISFALQSENE